MGKFFTPFYLRVSLIFLVCSLLATSAQAQIMHLSPAKLKAQTRKNQKEAARYQAEHMETELEGQQKSLRKGDSARQQVGVQEEPAEYVYDKEKNAISDEPRPGKSRNRKNKRN
ncbi:MAG: hypothetical protein ACO1O1_06745 [Adhaeribacter sp.]